MNKHTLKILYVDDEPDNRKLVKKILVANGYDFIEATDGISGIDKAKRENPDLIIMDMNMPGLDGYEASTRLKSLPAFKNIPIIALTANAIPGDKERSLIAGCEGYISKPLDVDTFSDEIKTYLDGKIEKVKKEEQDEYLKAYTNKLVVRLEEKIRSLSEALDKSEQANTMKRDILLRMGHELRTPLHAIINIPEIFKKKYSDKMPDEQIDLLDIIYENGADLLGIIDNILLYSSLESSSVVLNASPIILTDLIQSVITQYLSSAEEKGLKLIQNCTPDLPVLTIDITQITTVFSLLIDNAIKFTKQGNITITCKTITALDSEIPKNISDSLNPQSSYILVCITDSGIGIEQENLQNIFSGFSQLEDPLTRNFSGIGVGLAISKRLIELHNGYLWATSKIGQGSSFYFIIPIDGES